MSAPKILLLEDNPGLRQTIAKLMTKRGFEVHAVSSAEQALLATARESFDLIIADIRMDGMSGLDALEEIKRSHPEIASLIMTGYDTEPDRARALRLGAGDVLTKPCKLPALLESVNTILAQRLKSEDEPKRKAQSKKKKASVKRAQAEATEITAPARQPEDSSAKGGPDPTLSPQEASEARGGVAAERTIEPRDAKLETPEPPGTEPANPPEPSSPVENQEPHPEAELSDALLVLLETVLASALPPGASLLAKRASRQLGLSETQTRWTRAALVARALAETGRLSAVMDQLPEQLRLLTETAADPWESASVPSRIIAAVLELHPDVSDYDPEVLTALASSSDDEARPPTRLLNALLSTAGALRDKGQVAGSRYALKTVLAQSKCLRQTIDSELGLSALELEHGGDEAATRHAQRALEIAGRRGPRMEGQAHLQAGLIWSQAHPEKARAWLERALELAAQVNDPLLAAAAQVGLVRFGFSNGGYWPHLKPLAHPQGVPERAEAISWLLPGLLASEEMEVGKVLQAWVPEYPEVLDKLLARDELPPAARQRALELRNLDERRRPGLRVLSLGEFQLYRGTELSTGWKSQKVRYLLAYLMGCGNARVSDEVLIDKLWPELDMAAGQESLGSALELLEEHLKENLGVENVILRDSTGTGINPEALLWHDVEELSKLAKRAAEMAKKGQPEVEAVLRRMLDLFRGPYLDGCAMGWAQERRQQMERYARESAARLTDLYTRRNQPEQVVEIGLRALELDLCQESVAGRVLRALEKLDRNDAARAFYADLLQSVGKPPSGELREIASAMGL